MLEYTHNVCPALLQRLDGCGFSILWPGEGPRGPCVIYPHCSFPAAICVHGLPVVLQSSEFLCWCFSSHWPFHCGKSGRPLRAVPLLVAPQMTPLSPCSLTFSHNSKYTQNRKSGIGHIGARECQGGGDAVAREAGTHTGKHCAASFLNGVQPWDPPASSPVMEATSVPISLLCPGGGLKMASHLKQQLCASLRDRLAG